MYLYHYYEKALGPFKNLSELPREEANNVIKRIKETKPNVQCASRDDDWKEYRRKLYTYKEILEIIKKYDLPQKWNDDGKFGPERYVEAHIWSDKTIGKYRQMENK
ncbi:MAG: hypothetical protein IKL22_02565 [Lachnospiraceae bacterium]|nr:hypothetical protein [Lachnospiraceae bacterium]